MKSFSHNFTNIVPTNIKHFSPMLIDIRGKINEKKLAYNNTLLPLYEAIVNSIHSIEEDSATKPGIIEITLVRSKQQKLEFENSTPAILDFIIKDNGAGFNESNFESFNFAHSTYKEKKGGKGIGRFIWLRAFQLAEIESIYKENGHLAYRRFNFEPTKDGIEKHEKDILSEKRERFTEVRLKGLKPDYQKWCNTNYEDIALKIIEHCFVYFLSDDCPRIIINDGNNQVVVNDLFKLYTKDQVKTKPITIKDQTFQLNLVKLYTSKLDNKIHYCADTREVQNDKLINDIPELDSFLKDSEGSKFSIAAYLSGEYLDEKVNEERTAIHFPKYDVGDIDFPNEISYEEIRTAIIDIVKEELSEYIDGLSESRLEKVKNFIKHHPRYKQLLKYKSEDLKKISSKLPEEKLEIELFKIQQKLDLEVRIEAEAVLKEIDKVDDLEEFKKHHLGLYDKITEVGNSKLSEYVIHRKLVLDLLSKHLKRNEEGKYVTEDVIHKLIFPLKKISDEIGFEDHNLWVIDERLAFHEYLASDKQFKQIKKLESKSGDRPDIIIFNKPFVFSENAKPYSSIVLIEFKRPMRDEYNDEENPIAQINKYAREIISGTAQDKSGKTFDLRPSTPIYAYIICDLTPKLRTFAADAGYIKLPDNDGYFHFNTNHNLYAEIISFDKLIRDSKQRNKALFEKLNLPSN